MPASLYCCCHDALYLQGPPVSCIQQGTFSALIVTFKHEMAV